MLPLIPFIFGIIVALSGPRSLAFAEGFAIREQSATALGNAFAGSTAGAEDLSYMFFNPAGLTRQSGNQVLVVGSYIAPRSEFTLEGASTIAPISAPIAGGNGGADIAPNAFIPAAYVLWDASPRFKVGLGINVPFALGTRYRDGWSGRYHALQSKIHTIDVNPALAYRLTDTVSVGAGLSIQYVQTKLTNAIDFGTIGAAMVPAIPTAVPTQQDGQIRLEGDDVSFGFNVGVLFEPRDGTRFGASYRSHVSHTLKGDADLTLDTAGVGAAISKATGLFTDSAATASLTTPETLSFGIYHQISPQWAVMGEAAWTNWRRFDELRIQFANPVQPDNVTEQDWTTSWFFAAGLSYRPSDAWAVRAGVARDQTAIPDDRRTPRIPSNDRTWIAIGASYEPHESVSISIGYSHLFVSKSPVNMLASSPGNTFRGNLSGSFRNSVDIVTVQGIVRF